MHKSAAPLLALFLVLVGMTVSSVAHANSSGIAGYTGKQGGTCADCHKGGATPTVKLTGPSTLAAGQSAEYSVLVTGNGATAAAVAATDGVKLTAGGGFRDSFGEMVQAAAQGGNGTFKFTMTAPANGNTVKLWLVGLGGGSQNNSAVKALTADITITGGGTGPIATGDAGTGAGTGTGTGGGDGDGGVDTTTGGGDPTAQTDGGAPTSSSKKSTTKKTGDDADDDDDEDDDDGNDRRAKMGSGYSSCNASSGMIHGTAMGAAVFALFAFGLGLRRREEKR